MNLPKLAIERPVFMSCVVIMIMVLGIMGYFSLGVDLFPDVSFPFVFVTVPYQGASPEEIETQISKPMEDELSSLQGVKKVSSSNQEGFAVIWVQFTLETDAKDAEQQVRDRVAFVRPQLPKGVDEPIIRRFDPTDQAVAILSLQAPGLSAADIYDLADQYIKPRLAEVPGVGVVNIVGGHKREIQVQLDRDQLNRYRISAGQVADKIGLNGMNVPVGKVDLGPRELLFRSVGEYNDLERIKRTPVNFYGSDVSVTVDKLGQVIDTTADPDSYSFVNGQPTLVLQVFKQSKANTVAVVDGALRQMDRINEFLKARPGNPQLSLIQEMARPVRMNLADVQFTIAEGICLTILVVLLFLGSFRSTLITITSLPVSLLGAFFLMNSQGYTLNVMTLLALSLAVGLLIDDAIVVRENIWRHIEEGVDPKKAAVDGALEVALAVVATSSVIIAVFLPIAFLKGIVGQFFREFGMTVCFAMAISLFEAMVMGPLLSAYWARKSSKEDKELPVIGPILKAFSRFQDFLEARYSLLIDWCLKNRKKVIGGAIFLFFFSMVVLGPKIKFTFLPTADVGEFVVLLKSAPGTSLEEMRQKTEEVAQVIQRHAEVVVLSGSIGGVDASGAQSGVNKARLYIRLKPYQQRKYTTSDLMTMVRKELTPYKEILQPQVAEASAFGDQAPFNLDLVGDDYATLVPFADQVAEKIRGVKDLADVQSTYDGGKPEFQAVLDPERMKVLGVSGVDAGMELRTQVEGLVAAKLRQHGEDYDIRVRLKEDQRNLEQQYPIILVPNQNHNMVRLSDISHPVTTEGPARIDRQDRARYIMISGQIAPGGALGGAIDKAKEIMKDMKLPPGVTYEFVGQAQDLQDLMLSMLEAVGLAVLFTYMILASLYESPIIPFTIMLAIPLAIVGAFFALFIGQIFVPTLSLNIFSMVALIMLLGLVTKNSILLVDYTLQMMRKGMPRDEALKAAGKVRLRPILMTTFALIAGILPVALALTEVGKFRQSMGVAIEGGLFSSLLLTLVIVPSVFGYVDDFRLWLTKIFSALNAEPAATNAGKPTKRH
jgi:HAE1 family hydrophobic/amphiphilic exporter-1